MKRFLTAPLTQVLLGILFWLYLFILCYVGGFVLYDIEYPASTVVTVDPENVPTVWGLLLNYAKIVLFIPLWQWTNLAMLVSCASVVGEAGRAIQKGEDKPQFTAALARGFYVYILLMTGQLIIAGSLDTSTKPHDAQSIKAKAGKADITLREAQGPEVVDKSRYFRLAGAGSFIAFAVSFSPAFFSKLLADRLAKQPTDAAPGHETAHK